MKYVMLLRGMGPGDPNFNNQVICACLEGLGFNSVRSLQASGNYLFESAETDHAKLEAMIEAAIEADTGYKRAAIVKNAGRIAALMKLDPFKGLKHSESSYLLVTFLQRPQKPGFTLPYQPPGKPYTIIGAQHGMVFSVTDNSVIKTSDLMTWLEKQFGKDITSRSWGTMQRIHKKLAGS